MRFDLVINAKKDFDEWKAADKQAAADIMALLMQMRADPLLQDRLLDRKSEDNGLSISRWEEQFRKGNDLYKIKSITPEGYSNAKWRILYAYFPPSAAVIDPEVYVMAIVHRDKFNYEADHEITARIHQDLRTIRY